MHIRVRTCTCTYTYTHTHTHTWTYAYSRTHMHIRVRTCTCTYINAHTRIHIPTSYLESPRGWSGQPLIESPRAIVWAAIAPGLRARARHRVRLAPRSCAIRHPSSKRFSGVDRSRKGVGSSRAVRGGGGGGGGALLAINKARGDWRETKTRGERGRQRDSFLNPTPFYLLVELTQCVCTVRVHPSQD